MLFLYFADTSRAVPGPMSRDNAVCRICAMIVLGTVSGCPLATVHPGGSSDGENCTRKLARPLILLYSYLQDIPLCLTGMARCPVLVYGSGDR